MLYLHLCLLWHGALLRNLRISVRPQLENFISSKYNTSQSWTDYGSSYRFQHLRPPVYSVSILHPGPSLSIQRPNRQLFSCTYRQMDIRSCHYSIGFLLKLQLCQTLSDTNTHKRLNTSTHPRVLQLVEKQHSQRSHSVMWQVLSGQPLHRSSYMPCPCMHVRCVHAWTSWG